MKHNKIDVKKLKLNQELILIRYSQSPHPTYITVFFKGYDETNEVLTYSNYPSSNDKKYRVKKLTLKQIEFKLFIDIDELARGLFNCFSKRNLPIVDTYKKIILESQENRPEIWI